MVRSLWDCAVIGLVHLLKLTRNSAKLIDELVADVARLVSNVSSNSDKYCGRRSILKNNHDVTIMT